jgi:hypothetical protein
MDSFFKALSKSDFKIREVTKGVLTQARAKSEPYAFIRLNEVAVKTFYDHAEYYPWNGMRTLTADCTSLLLPYHPSIIEEFGMQKYSRKAVSECSLAMVSLLYDVLNQKTIDARIFPYKTSKENCWFNTLKR